MTEHEKIKKVLEIVLPGGKKDLSDFEPDVVGAIATVYKKIGFGLFLYAELQFHETTVVMVTGLAKRPYWLDPVAILGTASIPYDHFFKEHKSAADTFHQVVIASVTLFSKTVSNVI